GFFNQSISKWMTIVLTILIRPISDPHNHTDNTLLVRKAAKAIKIAFRSTVTLSFIFNSFESTLNLQLAPMQQVRP
ncbi:hypothetical protein, partial [Streptococcus gordonii]|uniref:hypothetical protein n=1 Tax=Streptococcus gordonii TaxID=1302 RepID=UPI0023B10F28